MAKIVINACFGGFSLSRTAVLLARQLSGNPKWGGACIKGDRYEDGTPVPNNYGQVDDEVPRNDPFLVRVVEQLGTKADGACAHLCVVELTDGTKYKIDEYDGRETVTTPDHITWKVA